jgi:hypothetical protein
MSSESARDEALKSPCGNALHIMTCPLQSVALAAPQPPAGKGAVSVIVQEAAKELRRMAEGRMMSEAVAVPDWMEEARQIAAQCWCDEETLKTPMDVVLAESVARRIAAWMETGAQHARNESYWRERAKAAEARCVELSANNAAQFTRAEAADRALAGAKAQALREAAEEIADELRLMASEYDRGYLLSQPEGDVK